MSEGRESCLMIGTGHMGVGKSYTTQEFLTHYHKSTGRKILIFDPNNEPAYRKYPSVWFDVLEVQAARKQEAKEGRRIVTKSEKIIAQIPHGQIRRVEPFTKYGEKMSIEQMRHTMVAICNSFWNGLILLEDINRYIQNFESTEVLGIFKTIRHQSQDILFHTQSLNPLRPIHYEACKVIRMHNDNFDVDRLRSRLAEHYEIIKLAQLIVRAQYLKGNKRYYCYVHPLEKQIKGISYKQFYEACITYLTSRKEVFREIALVIARSNQRTSPNHSDNEAAMIRWISEHLFYLPPELHPQMVTKN